MKQFAAILLGMALACFGSGCCHPSVTAVPLSAWNQDEPKGIPFYLPKPLLIVGKNFRNIEDAKVGLTDSAPIPNYFDDQAKFADLNARTSFVPYGSASSGQAPAGTSPASTFPTGVTGTLATNSPPRTFSDKGAPVTPGTAPPDGLTPETFYTYQIVFVPDMTQKYGLRIKGGVGEIRAAMNLVNGWQFTGLGPYYMKDSSTAQNTLAAGITANLAASGVADVISSVAGLRSGARGKGEAGEPEARNVTEVFEKVERFGPHGPPMRLEGFAEIHVYEPHVTCDGQMQWVQISDLQFYRDFLGTSRDRLTRTPVPPILPKTSGKTEAGVPMKIGGTSEAGVPAAAAGVPASGVNQVNVNQYCPACSAAPACHKDCSFLEKCLDKICKPKHKIMVSQDDREGDLTEIPAQAVFTPSRPLPAPGGGPSTLAPIVPAFSGVPKSPAGAGELLPKPQPKE